MAADSDVSTSTTYEVTVTFLMEQPDDLLLRQSEIEDNVTMTFDDLVSGPLATIGFALVTPGTFVAEVAVFDEDNEDEEDG